MKISKILAAATAATLVVSPVMAAAPSASALSLSNAPTVSRASAESPRENRLGGGSIIAAILAAAIVAAGIYIAVDDDDDDSVSA